MTDKAKLEEIKKLADAMYYAAFNLTTDASLLRKAMEEYHQFITHEYHKEEPVSEDLIQASEEYVSPWQVYAEDADGELLLTNEPCERAFIAGAQWQKKIIMKSAFPCEIRKAIKVGTTMLCGNFAHADAGDKVKIIMIKEG